MLSSDVAQTKKSINVLVVLMVDQRLSPEFNGMQHTLSKFGSEKISFNLMTYKVPTVTPAHEFALLLTHSNVQNYVVALQQRINLIFPDLSTRLIVIMTNADHIHKIVSFWSTLTRIGYFNVYAVLHHFRSFKVYRTYLMQDEFLITESPDIKFLTVKEMSENSWMLEINVVFYNSYPMSYVENGEIIGAEG